MGCGGATAFVNEKNDIGTTEYRPTPHFNFFSRSLHAFYFPLPVC
jgi:hypothetical protein